MVLRFTNVNWKNAEGIAFHADQMDLSSLPWDREVFDARFRGHARNRHAPLAMPTEKTSPLSGEMGSAHVVSEAPDGIWKFSRVSLTQAKWGRAPDFLFRADQLEASARRPETPPKNHARYRPDGDRERRRQRDAAREHGKPVRAENGGDGCGDARVMGPVPDFRRKDSVAVWNTDSGVVEFDKLNMNWGPPCSSEAKGHHRFRR